MSPDVQASLTMPVVGDARNHGQAIVTSRLPARRGTPGLGGSTKHPKFRPRARGQLTLREGRRYSGPRKGRP